MVHLATPWPTEGKLCSSQAVSAPMAYSARLLNKEYQIVKASGPALVSVLRAFNYTSQGEVGSLLCFVALSPFAFIKARTTCCGMHQILTKQSREGLIPQNKWFRTAAPLSSSSPIPALITSYVYENLPCPPKEGVS